MLAKLALSARLEGVGPRGDTGTAFSGLAARCGVPCRADKGAVGAGIRDPVLGAGTAKPPDATGGSGAVGVAAAAATSVPILRGVVRVAEVPASKALRRCGGGAMVGATGAAPAKGRLMFKLAFKRLESKNDDDAWAEAGRAVLTPVVGAAPGLAGDAATP